MSEVKKVATQKAPIVIDPQITGTLDKYVSDANSGKIVVRNPAERSQVQEARGNVAAAYAKVCEKLDPLIKSAYETHKGLTGWKKTYTDKRNQFEAVAERAVKHFDDAAEEAHLAEQRRLQAIADEKTRKEREKAEAEARKQRQIEEEAQRKANEARRAAEQATAAERARLLKEAEANDRKAAAANAKAEQKTELAAAVIPTTIEVASAFQKTEGERERTTWKARIVDITKIPPSVYLSEKGVIDAIQIKLNKIAISNKNALPVSGVEFYQEKSNKVG